MKSTKMSAPILFSRVGLPRRYILLNPSPHIFLILCYEVWVAFGLFFMLVGSVFRSFFFSVFGRLKSNYSFATFCVSAQDGIPYYLNNQRDIFLN